MKHTVWLIILVGTFLFGGCADVVKEADSTFIDITKLPMMFNPIDKEAERMLYESMYTSPVPWNKADLEKVLSARGTLKMAADYLNDKEKLEGGVTFFALREFLGFTTYAFKIYEEGADGRAYQSGKVNYPNGLGPLEDVLTDRERWIYERVKGDVWTNLTALRAYINVVAEDINGEVNAATLARFKEAFKIVETIIPIKLPDNLDF